MSATPLEQKLQQLHQLHPKLIDLSLDRIDGLLAKLGNPHLSLPPVIHVAGTNGKGSSCAFIRAIAEAAGQRVHVYSSPHLVRFNERIRLAGELISDDALLALLEECERVNDNAPMTFFEMTTAAALLAFSRTPADLLVLEVGLGGRLDATNVVPRPAASLITTISYDHRNYLGDSIEQIAGEKAGIIKPNIPVVVGYQLYPQAIAVFKEQAAACSAPLLMAGEDWLVEPQSDGFRFVMDQVSWDLPMPGLLGQHQILNAGGALASLAATQLFPLQRSAAARGLTAVEWPARLQRLRQGRLLVDLPLGVELWLDGGHNDSGGLVLAQQAKAWADLPLALVVGMINTKDPREFLAPLAPLAEQIATVPIIDEPLSLSAEEVAAAARDVGGRHVMACGDAASALAQLLADGRRRRVLICGSLYLAGRILTEND